MSIRLKIALGFVLLTVVIVSSVSFWAAQSLGFSIDSSDLEKLGALKLEISALLEKEQAVLDRICQDTAQSFLDLNMLEKSFAEKQRFSESLKSNLDLDWLEAFSSGKPVISEFSAIKLPPPSSAAPLRLAKSGPYSYHGYLISNSKIATNSTISIARRPDFSKTKVPVFCIFDQHGIIEAKNYHESFEFLQQLVEGNTTEQIKTKNEIFRVRVFKLGYDCHILTGYPAQRAMISKLDIDQLMIRLAVLQVTGLLLLGYFLGRRLLAPLRALGSGIEKVAQGDWKEITLDQPPMKGSGDEIESVAMSFNKMVRELSSAQSRLIEIQKELAKKEKLAALGRFSAGIAHEINNPLGTILLNAGLIKESLEKGSEVGVDEIEEIVDEVKRCKNIISTLRTYTTQTKPSLSEHEFKKVFAHLTDFVSGIEEFKEIVIKTANSVDGLIMLDLPAMTQVFQNLVKNAAEAMHKNEFKEIYISASMEETHYVISFRDNGEGFKCEPELIFEPLFTTKAQGTGLGLIICQAIVEGHGGKMTAARDGEYTDFKILLPAASKENLT